MLTGIKIKDDSVTKHKNSLTIGVEEELFIVSTKSGQMVDTLPNEFLKACQEDFGEQIIPEFLTSQLELITKPCHNLDELAEQLSSLRQHLIKASKQFKLSPIAASTHPMACWRNQKPNLSERYKRLASDLKIAASRMLVGGLHVHVGLDNDEQRIDVLNHLTWYLPFLLSLSTSSPFWAGMDTGLNSYRASVIEGLPRSGLPKYFEDYPSYRHYIDSLIRAGAVSDGRELWWDARLSWRFPTVEMRITDICTDINDTLAIAALYQCLVSWIIQGNTKQRSMLLSNVIAHENRWRAQRYSVLAGELIDCLDDTMISFRDLTYHFLDVLAKPAKELGCLSYLEHIETIVNHGTSADKQRQIYQKVLKEQGSREEAFSEVMRFLIKTTAKLPHNMAKKKHQNAQKQDKSALQDATA